MSECPKCGGRYIAGPRFVQIYGYDRLRYECITCGYSKTTPTKDANVRRAALADAGEDGGAANDG